MNYKDKMSDIRIGQNISQKEMAKILNISPFTYSHYETQDATIPIKHLIAFCDYLNISIDYIFSFTDKSLNSEFKEVNAIISGKRLKEFRKEQNITQETLAKYLNTNRSLLSNYEKGLYLIATPFLYMICKKYNISADYLLGRIDSPKYLK